MTITEKIKELDISLYPKIWCSLNSFEFPEELKEYKPVNWDLMLPINKCGFLDEPMDWIETVVSEKELLREWNKDRYPGIEFDIWWENREKKPLSDEAVKILKYLYNIENKTN